MVRLMVTTMVDQWVESGRPKGAAHKTVVGAPAEKQAIVTCWRMWRLCRLANLSVRKRPKVKQVAGERQQLPVSRHINEAWMLNILEHFDLAGLEHNSPAYLQRVCEAVNHPRDGLYVLAASSA